MTTMFAYPSDKMINVGTDNEGNDIYRLFIMFYDDSDWASAIIGEGQESQGQVLMNAIDFHIPTPEANETNAQPAVSSMLKQSYPNPFSSNSTFECDLKKSGDVSLKMYNVKGQLVKTLVDDYQTASTHQIMWDGKDDFGRTVSCGLYFSKLSTSGISETRKIVIIK